MNAEEFISKALKESEQDYGLCSPPTKAQDGIHILCEHFLGEDWYSMMPQSSEQVNTEIIYDILKKYPKRRSLIEIGNELFIRRFRR